MVVAALAFDYINGFHDAANAVATVVSTGVLPLRTAILLAAALNVLGAFTGTAVASTIGQGLVEPGAVSQAVVLAALLGAIAWNLVTWYFGIPSSSSHALVGGLVGAALAHAGPRAIRVEGLLKVVESLVVSPLVGLRDRVRDDDRPLLDLPEGPALPARPHLPAAADGLGRLHGGLARQQRRAEDDGDHHPEPGGLRRGLGGGGPVRRSPPG